MWMLPAAVGNATRPCRARRGGLGQVSTALALLGMFLAEGSYGEDGEQNASCPEHKGGLNLIEIHDTLCIDTHEPLQQKVLGRPIQVFDAHALTEHTQFMLSKKPAQSTTSDESISRTNGTFTPDYAGTYSVVAKTSIPACKYIQKEVTIDFCICKLHLDPYSSCKNRAARAPSRKIVAQQNVSHVGASPMKNLPYAKLGKRPPKPQLWGQKKHRINFQIALCLGGLFLVSLASVPIIRRCIGKQRKKHTYKKSYSQQSRGVRDMNYDELATVSAGVSSSVNAPRSRGAKGNLGL